MLGGETGKDGADERGRVDLLVWWHHNRELVPSGEEIELSDGEELEVGGGSSRRRRDDAEGVLLSA